MRSQRLIAILSFNFTNDFSLWVYVTMFFLANCLSTSCDMNSMLINMYGHHQLMNVNCNSAICHLGLVLTCAVLCLFCDSTLFLSFLN